MHGRIWRFCLITGVAAGFLRLWIHYPVATVLAVPVAAAYVLVLSRVWHWAFTSGQDGPRPPAPSLRTAGLGTLVGFGFAGLLHLDVLVGLTALVVAAVTSPWLLGRWVTEGRRAAVAAPATAPATVPDARDEARSRLDQVLATLDDAELCRRWRQSFIDLKLTGPDRRWRVVELRAAYLDEMSRRHPHAVSAWMADDACAWTSPEAYFRRSA